MCRLSRRRKQRTGFTLLEALIAMALMVLLLSGVLSGISWHVGQLAKRTEQAWLTELARSVADEYRITRDPTLLEGRTPSDRSWRVSISRPPDDVWEGDGLNEVKVTAWQSEQTDSSVTLTFLIPVPTP